ncbi:MAG: hypothetical protein ACEQSK_06015 [Sphingomonadaceae bacterium]
MSEVSVPVTRARSGLQITTNKITNIQVRMASIEILVGGPYPEHPYGHTALRVTTLDKDKVYDYGRYGRTWGVGNSEGDGILNIWESFQAYIKEESTHKRITAGFVYEISEEQANAINEFYKNKIKNKNHLKSNPNYNSYLIDKYYALGPNCTTLSIAGAKIAIPSIDKDWKKYQEGRGLSTMEKGIVSLKSWPNYIFMPADLKAMLEASDKKSKKINTYK